MHYLDCSFNAQQQRAIEYEMLSEYSATGGTAAAGVQNQMFARALQAQRNAVEPRAS